MEKKTIDLKGGASNWGGKGGWEPGSNHSNHKQDDASENAEGRGPAGWGGGDFGNKLNQGQSEEALITRCTHHRGEGRGPFEEPKCNCPLKD